MRIQLASDLHLEFLAEQFPQATLISPAPDADLLVLAGDVDNGLRAIQLFGAWPVPVLYVAGNHEFYSRDWQTTRNALRKASAGTSVIYLDHDQADENSLNCFAAWAEPRTDELRKLRFLGATLWTDYRLQPGILQRCAMEEAEMRISDHFQINTRLGKFTALQALSAHESAREWLKAELAKPFEGKTVVITHHAPHRLSIHPRFLAPGTFKLNAAFASDLADLMPKVDLWLHGHVHDSFDYKVDNCRVVANPRGYPLNRQAAGSVAELRFENPAFLPCCVIEV